MLFIPGTEIGILAILDGGQVFARKASQQAFGFFQTVIDAFDDAGVTYFCSLVTGACSLDDGNIGPGFSHLGWIAAVTRKTYFCRQFITAGTSWITRQQDRITVLQTLCRYHQEVFGLIRDIVGRRVGGATILAHIGAQK